jgi:hypothetical protein
MTTQLSGVLLDGLQTGLLADLNRITSILVSTTSALSGTLTLGDKTGTMFTSSGALNGVQAAGVDAFGPVYFSLSNPADIGKARVSWKSI